MTTPTLEQQQQQIATIKRQAETLPAAPFVRLRQESAGKVYFVKFDDGAAHDVTETPAGLECDCRGYEYRKDCRHVREVARLLPKADLEAAAVRERVRGELARDSRQMSFPVAPASAPEPSALPLAMPSKPRGEKFRGVTL